MPARQPIPTGAKQSRPLQILVYTPQSGGVKGAPQTSEVFDVSGSSKAGAGGSRTLEFANGNGQTLRIPEYTTHIVRSSTPGKTEGQYYPPIATTPAAPICPHHYHHHHHHHSQYPDHFLHLYPSHQELSLPLPPPPHPPFILPTPQQSPEFSMTTTTIPPISEEEWTMLTSPESPLPGEMLGLTPGSPVVTKELLEACLPVDSTEEGRQWWYELLCAGDEQGFWTRFLESDERAIGDEVGWGGNVAEEMQGGCGGLEGGPGGWED